VREYGVCIMHLLSGSRPNKVLLILMAVDLTAAPCTFQLLPGKGKEPRDR